MSNPALNGKIFQRETEAEAGDQGAFTPGWGSPAQEVPPGLFGAQPGSAPPPPVQRPPTRPGDGDTMRLSGTMSAAAILLGLLMVAAWFGWQAVTVTHLGTSPSGQTLVDISAPPWLFVSVIVGFGIAILTIFKPKLARITAPLYAVAEGVFLGAISAVFNAYWAGIVVQAVMLTFGVFIMMLILFATGTVKVTQRLRTGIIAATGAVCLVYLVSIIASLFGTSVPLVHSNSGWGILFSLLVVGIASMNLLLDFDFIQQAVAMKAPRYMEWFGAFGLMITLVWLYLELLRLLAKLRSR